MGLTRQVVNRPCQSGSQRKDNATGKLPLPKRQNPILNHWLIHRSNYDFVLKHHFVVTIKNPPVTGKHFSGNRRTTNELTPIEPSVPTMLKNGCRNGSPHRIIDRSTNRNTNRSTNRLPGGSLNLPNRYFPFIV